MVLETQATNADRPPHRSENSSGYIDKGLKDVVCPNEFGLKYVLGFPYLLL